MSNVITTQQAAEALGMTQDGLLAWLHRNPTFRPAIKIGQVHLWADAEIEAVRVRRQELRSRKPKAQRSES